MTLTIGKLSRTTGVNVETIRYYERIGLLTTAMRTESGYRTFGEREVARLRFIKRGRELGFSLDEVRTLAELADQPGQPCADVDRLVAQHLIEVRQRIADLQRLEFELERLVGCTESSVKECRIVEALSGGAVVGDCRA
ncbi:MerR family transcriptional regulator [Stutzerimonas nosocomialis]|uniref:MerR family transcriptional regulator n=1 Tax=Stutzerimonas nosocomialis TaxID=1056496 RepID=A0A5R9QFV6_9GAMM|nr:helix-turn-helix domain-containing protein [Stutzerimonas nosocomialis]TLX64011.1 MerR family transcriptional regulator [Stutzerimonas nosocomialis]